MPPAKKPTPTPTPSIVPIVPKAAPTVGQVKDELEIDWPADPNDSTDPNDSAAPTPPTTEVDRPIVAIPTSTQATSRSCLIIGIVYALFYFSGVLLFWQLGGITHRSTLNTGGLDQAGNLEEIRNELVKQFGPVDLTPLDKTSSTLQNATTAAESAANQAAATAGQVQQTASQLQTAANTAANAASTASTAANAIRH